MTAPVIDGSGYVTSDAHTNSFNTSGNPLSTAHGGEAIICVVEWSSYSANTASSVSSISSSNTTGWTKLGNWSVAGDFSTTCYMEIWYGLAASSLTNEAITITFAGGNTDNMSAIVFGVYDSAAAYTATPLDPNANAIIDATAPSNTGLGSITGLSTTGTTDLALAIYGTTENTSGEGPPSGFTEIVSGGVHNPSGLSQAYTFLER